ncbi:hypothetical protein H9660_07985 [Clostridium sp. Sa3CUN1]|uniref:Uncharacterized protein n=1 Tax=Clostridium gallinarum TaxID=2762246 RepID=A0ABR8Q3T3_9CLOT|nr:permease prefix domain 1-containing protein [Clostridium gallinarum]MBD7915088.1 hypothetical protein [Clostridium gallinarum]
MNKIEEYVEKIYKKFDEKDEETKILKEETKVHLLEEVKELRKQGLSENESIEKAITNFGEEKTVIKEMSLILKKQSKFINVLKKFTIILFIIACVCLSINIADQFINRNESDIYTADENTTTYIFDVIAKKIKNEDTLDSNLKNEITQLLDEFNAKHNNGLYYLKIAREDMPDINYEYKIDIPEGSIEGEYGSVMGVYSEKGIEWGIDSNTTYEQTSYDYKAHSDARNKMINRIPNRLGRISNYLFVVTIVLFCIYLMSNIYLKRTFLRNRFLKI